jgi:hypothetical protein
LTFYDAMEGLKDALLTKKASHDRDGVVRVPVFESIRPPPLTLPLVLEKTGIMGEAPPSDER